MFYSVGELLRSLFLYLDKVVYRLMGNLYELFIEIASVNFFSDDTITTFAARVYGLLAIFMLFRISFSILTYIVNPDSINDKTAGSGRLIGNFLITIIMLISAPWLFMQAMNLQKTILQENIIGKIILGVGSDDSISYQFGAGYEMGWTTFSAFFYPNIGTCNRSNLNYVPYEYNESDPSSNSCCNDMGADGQCKTWHHLTVGKYVNAIDGDVVNAIVETNGVETEVYEYNYGVSTLAGVFICYILLLFCIQIAVRSVKFGFLQLIAPIPIISYIDPKHGKDGMFKKWLKVCGKTYADIFIRLAAIYFALFIITEIGQSGAMINTITNKPAGPLAKVLMIMGALMFAKELPKFIEEITGIKLDGGFSLNPFKNNPFLSAAAGGLVGAGLGTVGALTGGSALSGVTGAFRGMRSGFSGKKLGEIASGQTGSNAKMRTARLNGSTFGGRLRSSLGNTFGTGGALARIEAEKMAHQNEIDAIDNQIKGIEDQKKAIQGSDEYVARQGQLADQKALADSIKAMEERAKSEIMAGNSPLGEEYLKRKAQADYFRNNVGKMHTFADGTKRKITTDDVATADARTNNWVNDEGMKEYLTRASAGEFDQGTFGTLRANAELAATNAGITLATSGGDIHGQYGTAKGTIGTLERAGNDDARRIAEYDQQIAAHNREKAPHNDAIRNLNERERAEKANADATKR